MIESEVIKQFRILVQSWIPDAIIEKINQGPYSTKGVPDLLVMALGGTAILEAKSATGSLSDLQKLMLPRMAKAGGPVGVLWGTDAPYTFELENYKTGTEVVLRGVFHVAAYLRRRDTKSLLLSTHY